MLHVGVTSSSDLKSFVAAKLNELDPYHHKSKYTLDDIGRAKLYTMCFQDILRYVPEREIWYYYDGKQWRDDCGNGEVTRLWAIYADNWLEYAHRFDDIEKRTYRSIRKQKGKNIFTLYLRYKRVALYERNVKIRSVVHEKVNIRI